DVFRSCGVLRTTAPEAVERARAEAAAGAPMPRFDEHARGVAAELPGEGGAQLPINAALRAAIEREALAAQLHGLAAEAATLEPEPPDGRPEGGAPRPGARRRRRRAA
ncbi:MAG: hypothetical protein R3F34_15865, partial [Planctomycetota bacterium]